MKSIIPGHVRAVTWLLTLVLALVTYYITGNGWSVLGAIVLSAGFFLADQATHLAQEDHSAPPPTWVERMQQKHRGLSVVAGLLLVIVGAILMLRLY